jgi:hypothetical protein
MMPGALQDYVTTIPAMLRRAATLGQPIQREERRGAASPQWTPEALARSGAFAFHVLAAEFEKALAARPDETEIFWRRIAGLCVRFRVVGRAVALQVTQSLGHLPADPPATGVADVTIDAWDEQATGISSAVRPSNPDLSPYGMMLYSPDSRFISYQRPEAASWLDRTRRHIVSWYHSADRVYLDQRAKPFNKLLFDPLRDRGIVMAHAGFVTRGGLGALIPGLSGAGKSTSTLACLAAGFKFLSDDYVGVQEMSNGSFCGHSLFASAVLDPGHLKRFPVFLPDAEPTQHKHEIKSMLPLVHRHRHQLALASTIGLILLPRIVDAEVTTCRPASKRAALMALAPPSLLSMPRPQIEAFDMLVRLAERTPAFWLELGRNIETIPHAVAAALEREAVR